MRTFQIKSNAPMGKSGPAATIEAATPHAAVQALCDQHAHTAILGALRWEQPAEDQDGRLFSRWSCNLIWPTDVPEGAPARVFIAEQIGGFGCAVTEYYANRASGPHGHH
jgi:hypothetical protein